MVDVDAPGRSTARLMGLFEDLVRADDMPAFERTYLSHASRIVQMPMRGLYTFGRSCHEAATIATDGVSDLFLARYEDVRPVDFLLERVVAERTVAVSTMFMPVEEWRRHELFTYVLRLHEMVWVIQAPVLCDDEPVGTLNWGSDFRRGAPTAAEWDMAAALGRIVGVALGVMRHRRLMARAHGQLCAALDASATPVAITDGERGERHLNASARALVERIEGGADWIDRMTARTGGEVPAHAERDVPLSAGGRTRLHVRTRMLEDFPSTTVSILDLEGVPRSAPAAHLTQLTAREREVAALVAEALTDAQIAERLHLSPHTVREYLKIIYRKVGVTSRVGLARLVLTSPGAGDAGDAP